MQKILSPALALLAAGMTLVGQSQAQQPQTAQQPAQTEQAQPAAGGASTLASDKDKVSYAIGMSIGATLNKEKMTVDLPLLEKGLQDSLSGTQTMLTQDQARAILIRAQQQLRAAEEERRKALGDTNKTEAEAFLAVNKNRPGVVTLPSGLQYKVLQQGTGPKPTLNDTVVCNYRGTLLNGQEFDSSYKRGHPITIPVSRVIKGWTEALQLMPVGSKWQLFVPADLAYADRGAGGVIGPNAALIFEVELLSIQNPPSLEHGPASPGNPPATQPAKPPTGF